jgi:hypothetical protein
MPFLSNFEKNICGLFQMALQKSKTESYVTMSNSSYTRRSRNRG